MKLYSTLRRIGVLVSSLGAPLLAFGCSGADAPTEPADHVGSVSSALTAEASCETCVPTTCAAEGASCGAIPDGCGGTRLLRLILRLLAGAVTSGTSAREAGEKSWQVSRGPRGDIQLRSPLARPSASHA